MLSDHFQSGDNLEAASARLKGGEPVSYDQSSVDMLMNDLPQLPTYFLGRRKTSWIALGIVVLIGLLMGGCFSTIFYLRH
jgi:hypothetical protein